MHELAQPIAVVCHDAGAANIIIEEMRAYPGTEYRPVMQGPAANLWQARGGSTHDLFPLDEALQGACSLLSGTGWASTLEHDARKRAKAIDLPTAALIDHWVNYASRFEREGNVVLPDEFWVPGQLRF